VLNELALGFLINASLGGFTSGSTEEDIFFRSAELKCNIARCSYREEGSKVSISKLRPVEGKVDIQDEEVGGDEEKKGREV
jgi:hypothetical protein